MYNDLFIALNPLNFLITIIQNFFFKTNRNIKLSTWAKVNRDVNSMYNVALYYRSDINDLHNTCITIEH